MTNATDDFTGDVTALVMAGEKSLRLHLLRSVPPDERPEFIRKGLLGALAPEMLKSPSLVQQIVARALMEHVDWRVVAVAAATDEEAN